MAKNEDILVKELQKISKLLVLNLADGKTNTEVIEMLSRIDFQPKEIAELLGTSANTVSVILSNLRKKSK
jgi:DNA-binding CsgD family transcriptional regulator